MKRSTEAKKGIKTAPKGLQSKVRQAKKIQRKRTAAKSQPKKRFTVDLSYLVAVFGLGFCGFMIGFLTGANELPPSEGYHTLLGVMTWQGGVTGLQEFHYAQGLLLGILGGVIGATVGRSLLMPSQKMIAALSTALLGLLLMIPFGIIPGLLGWIAGFIFYLPRNPPPSQHHPLNKKKTS